MFEFLSWGIGISLLPMKYARKREAVLGLLSRGLLLGFLGGVLGHLGEGVLAPDGARGFEELACSGKQGSGEAHGNQRVGSGITFEVFEELVHKNILVGRVVYYTSCFLRG
jgi:hypothetical protein